MNEIELVVVKKMKDKIIVISRVKDRVIFIEYSVGKKWLLKII